MTAACGEVMSAVQFGLTGPWVVAAPPISGPPRSNYLRASDNTQLKAALAKTGMGITSFTPQYGAPEQFNRAYGATGPWTDVYALALVAVEMLSGKPALDGDDLIQLAFGSGNPEKRPTSRALGAAVSDAVENVFRRALAVRPEDRYSRAREFWKDLEGAQAGSFSDTVLHSGVVTGQLPAVSVGQTQPTPMGIATRGPESNTSSPATLSTGTPVAKSNTGLIVGALAAVALLGVGGFLAFGKSKTDTEMPIAEGAKGAAATPPVASAAPPASASAAPALSCPTGMVLIPAGQFFMGSDAKKAAANQKPSHNVTLGAFCMDLYEGHGQPVP